MWRKGDTCALLVGMQTGAVTMENISMFIRKLKMELPYDPVIPFLGISLKNSKH